MSSQQDLTAQLTLIQGQGDSNFQRVIDLHKNNVNIGRAQTCDIIWGSLQISRQHATLEYINPRWYIRDSSTNGLSVNGNKLVKGELFPLSDSDTISFIPTGSVRYRFNYIQANSPSREVIFSGVQSRAISPQPSTSAQPTTSTGAVKTTHPNHRSESNSDSPSSASSSVSEDSNHSESLLSLGSPGAPDDFFSFSGDEAAGSPSVIPESFEGSPGANTSKRKHKSGDTSDSDNITLVDRKKKRLQFNASSDEDSRDINLTKSDREPSCISKTKVRSRSPNNWMLTDDQIAKCDDLKALKEHLRTCMTKLASTELNLETLKCKRDMEREDIKRKQDDVKSVNAAFKEETLKKIHELMESELSCAVCNEIFIQATVVDCGHTFCSFCINEWSRKKLECPICRKSFRNKSRHIEIENFIVKMYESLTPDMSSRRATSIKEREEQVKKSLEEARNAATTNRPGRGPAGANFHAFIHTTASHYVDFLAELHQINEILGPGNTGRGGRTNTSADRRRSARIQDRVIDAVVAGAGQSRGRNARGRGRNANAAAAGASNAQVQNAPLPPPAPQASRAHHRANAGLNANPVVPIPVVTLNDSPQNAEAPGAQLRLPQIMNYPLPRLNLIDINQPAGNQ